GEPQRGGTYRATEIQDPPTIDPYANAAVSTKTFAAHVYSRLFKIATEPGVDPFDQLPTPDLAESAETDDGMTWVVTLKQGARFQDVPPVSGREVTAED